MRYRGDGADLLTVLVRRKSKEIVVEILSGVTAREQAIVNLFEATFTASEGADEGVLIGGLVRNLLATTPADDIRVFRAEDAGHLVGAVVFTRLTYPDDPRLVVLLSPMAVASHRQRQGVGTTLIAHALSILRANGAEVAITYGDPAFYGRVGFKPITEEMAPAPRPLRLPHGWIGQSLTGEAFPAFSGRPACVPALNRPDVW
jgi:putative acetyltransferase